MATRQKLRLAIPKGRMHGGVVGLLRGAGIRLSDTARGYRPYISLPDCEVKVLKPQNIVEMLQAGSRDLGFTGAGWVAELDGRLEELQDTGLDPRLVDQVESALEAHARSAVIRKAGGDQKPWVLCLREPSSRSARRSLGPRSVSPGGRLPPVLRLPNREPTGEALDPA